MLLFMRMHEVGVVFRRCAWLLGWRGVDLIGSPLEYSLQWLLLVFTRDGEIGQCGEDALADRSELIKRQVECLEIGE